MTIDRRGLYCDSPSSIRTASGRRVDPLNMRVEDIDLEDVATSLSNTCRYGGHCGGFLSVARHSIWVSNRLQPVGDELALWGLLHDASEAYVGDLVSPLKHTDEMKIFRDIEDKVQEVIATAFVLPWPMPVEVKEADRFITVEIEIGLRFRDSQRTTPDEDRADFLALFDELEGALL